jgi:hypothetical protein
MNNGEIARLYIKKKASKVCVKHSSSQPFMRCAFVAPQHSHSSYEVQMNVTQLAAVSCILPLARDDRLEFLTPFISLASL